MASSPLCALSTYITSANGLPTTSVGPKICLGPWRDDIERWIGEGLSQAAMRERIALEGPTIGRTAFIKYLREQGLDMREPDAEVTESLRRRIIYIFHMFRVSDKDALDILQWDGYQIGLRRMAEIRRGLGLHKWHHNSRHIQLEEAAEKVLRVELSNGNIEDFGMRHLYTYLRTKYNLTGR